MKEKIFIAFSKPTLAPETKNSSDFAAAAKSQAAAKNQKLSWNFFLAWWFSQ